MAGFTSSAVCVGGALGSTAGVTTTAATEEGKEGVAGAGDTHVAEEGAAGFAALAVCVGFTATTSTTLALGQALVGEAWDG